MLKIGSLICKNKKLNSIRNLLAPYTKRAYVVGGGVRDMILGKKNTDFDIEIYDIAPKVFDDIMVRVGANGVGKSYFVYKLNDFDLSLPRTESKSGTGHKGFEVGYCNDEQLASRRRDFTINSIMINIFSGELLDFWGGTKDIKNRVLRHIDDEKFCEDSLRVLRAVQFSSRLNFKIYPKTMRLMQKLNIDDLSSDRITAELIKLFRAKFQGIGLENLAKLGLLKKFFGINLYGIELKKTVKKLQSATMFQKDEREFIYFLAKNFKISQDVLSSLNLPKSFNECFKQPFFEDQISDYELLCVSLKIPLKNWLGLNTKELISRAKKFNVYENKFCSNVNVNEIIAAGFSGEMIGKELLRRQKIEIKNFLKNKF